MKKCKEGEGDEKECRTKGNKARPVQSAFSQEDLLAWNEHSSQQGL